MPDFDVIVVGSGAAGLAAALAAAVDGATVLVLEKSPVLGGTTAMSSAGTWVPANHHMLAAGIADSAEETLTYLRATAPPGWAETEDELWQALAEHSAPMLRFLEDETPLRFELVNHPDFYVEAPGGKLFGRMVSPTPDQPLQARPLVEPGAAVGEAAVLHLQGDGRRRPQGSVRARSCGSRRSWSGV